MMESLAAIYNFNLISYISIVYKRVKMSSECKKKNKQINNNVRNCDREIIIVGVNNDIDIAELHDYKNKSLYFTANFLFFLI